MSLSVFFVLTPGVLLLDYAGPAEALRMAAEMGADMRLVTCAPVSPLPTSMGVSLDGLSPLPKSLPRESLVIVAGNARESEDYARPEAQAVIDWLARVARPDTCFASVCSAALLLARAGLLSGRQCTTHHNLIETLRALAPDATVLDDRIFVEDGPLLTSAGITTGIDLALYLIEGHFGPELAAMVARRQVVFMRRSGRDPQLSPWLAHRNHLHPAVHRAQDAIAREPGRRWSLAALAAQAHVSARHLTRLFAEHAGVGVLEYQHRLRLSYARRLLSDSGMSLERVAELSGFGSARDLRRVWSRFEDGSPGDLRRHH